MLPNIQQLISALQGKKKKKKLSLGHFIEQLNEKGLTSKLITKEHATSKLGAVWIHYHISNICLLLCLSMIIDCIFFISFHSKVSCLPLFFFLSFFQISIVAVNTKVMALLIWTKAFFFFNLQNAPFPML